MLERSAIAALGIAVTALSAVAQVGQFVAGGPIGSAFAQPAGDVDDDGQADVVVRLAQTWEVRSGATGTAFAFLTRSIPGVSSQYAGLCGDLDADGHDDLVFGDGGGVTQFVSGGDGSVLFQYVAPGSFAASTVAVDHDGDGHDDVMVAEVVSASVGAGVRNYHVLSGRNGSTIATHSMPFSATGYGFVQWCGDVDGDGHVDLLRTSVSTANPYTVVLLGPSFVPVLAAYSGTPVAAAADTDGDGRDELLVGPDLVDPTTATVVWSMWPTIPMPYTFAVDVDGDGAVDVLDGANRVFSGRLQAAWPALPWFASSVGDGDGDGRDELAIAGTSYELQGVPATSFVRDRGAA
ncbi:MAG: VCBS repeat-containing protein, partial [Planctomycetes bacterium]|nr:VCBS repeat-containing protein [Planctomycetota bacterium]